VFDMSSPQTGVLPEFQQAPPSQVFAEARTLRDAGAKFIGLRDESCLANALWVQEFCEQWQMQVGLPFWIVSRPEFLKESVFELLARAGCYRVHMVVEAGADHVRRRVLGRRVSDTHLLYAARAVRRFQMSLITINEIGFPGETEDMVRATIDLNRQMKPDWALCSVFHPVPGSAIFQRAEAKKWLTKSAYGIFYDPETKIEQPWIRGKKVQEYLDAFNAMVYGPKVIPGRRTRA
ncbi:MAG: radical SAM protein, partial [Planctomycetes bacterium]|nr:radical SAM protein [Planctomycetota bacterium]